MNQKNMLSALWGIQFVGLLLGLVIVMFGLSWTYLNLCGRGMNRSLELQQFDHLEGAAFSTQGPAAVGKTKAYSVALHVQFTAAEIQYWVPQHFSITM